MALAREQSSSAEPPEISQKLADLILHIACYSPLVSTVPTQYEKISGQKLDYKSLGFLTFSSFLCAIPTVIVTEDGKLERHPDAKNPHLLKSVVNVRPQVPDKDLAPAERNVQYTKLFRKIDSNLMLVKYRDFLCKHCNYVVYKPVILPCHHWYCTPCLEEHIQDTLSSDYPVCECCLKRFRKSDAVQPFKKETVVDEEAADRLIAMYKSLELFCIERKTGCQWKGTLWQLIHHIASCPIVNTRNKDFKPVLNLIEDQRQNSQQESNNSTEQIERIARTQREIQELVSRLLRDVKPAAKKRVREDFVAKEDSAAAAAARTIGQFRVYTSWNLDDNEDVDEETRSSVIRVVEGEMVQIYANPYNSFFGYCYGSRLPASPANPPGWLPSVCLLPPNEHRCLFIERFGPNGYDWTVV